MPDDEIEHHASEYERANERLHEYHRIAIRERDRAEAENKRMLGLLCRIDRICTGEEQGGYDNKGAIEFIHQLIVNYERASREGESAKENDDEGSAR